MDQQGKQLSNEGLKIPIKNILVSYRSHSKYLRGPNLRILTNHIQESV